MNTEAEPVEEEWVINNVNSSFKKPPKLSNAATRLVRAALPGRQQPASFGPAFNTAGPINVMANAPNESIATGSQEDNMQFPATLTPTDNRNSIKPVDSTPNRRRPRQRRYNDAKYNQAQGESEYTDGSCSPFSSKQALSSGPEQLGSYSVEDAVATPSPIGRNSVRSDSFGSASERTQGATQKPAVARPSPEKVSEKIKNGFVDGLPRQVVLCLLTALSEDKAKLSKAEKSAAYENCWQALRTGLSDCSDPVGFIIESILFLTGSDDKPNDPGHLKLERTIRTVVRILCESLESYIASLSKTKGVKLAARNDPTLLELVLKSSASKEEDLIDLNEITNDNIQAEDPEIITMADLQPFPFGNWKEKIIGLDDQRHLLDNLAISQHPVIVYLCMKPFRLSELLAAGQAEETLGIQLVESLMESNCMLEAIMCATTLKTVDKLDFEDVVTRIVLSGDTACIIRFAAVDEEMPRKLLNFFNSQLRFAYDGKFKIIPVERLEISSNLDNSPMRKLNERKVQKDLANFALRIMDSYGIDPKEYYFVFLTNSYVSLRWLISQRACQQVEENDYSIEATSNYNGLIYVLCHDVALKRLAVKEFIDMQDPYAAPYFAESFDQMAFYNEYISTPMSQRLISAIAGEQNSRSRVYLPRRKKKPATGKEHYKLPENVQLVIIDNSSGLTAMRSLLKRSQLCGLDTEWIPHLAKHAFMRTSLMQIASELGVVFLLDLVKLCGYNDGRVGFDGVTGAEPEDNIQQETFSFLKDLFTDQRITKLAYDFRGDIDMLSKTFPGISDVTLESFVDLANVNSCIPDQSETTFPLAGGGLTGVVETFLNRSLNKKQQISNWEQRPLSFEQAVYAAGDAYSLIEVFYTLYNMNHPILWDDKLGNGPSHL